MHLDLNSCFASIEQQADPFLRAKPVAVAAYDSPGGCIIAPSVEAKRMGIKVGMRVKDGRLICPQLIIKKPDPGKYRDVHLKLRKLLNDYTDGVVPKSIDEFVLDLEGAPAMRSRGIHDIAREIKARIKSEIGDWLRVSVGLGPNRFLAKTAAGLHKPDGLDEINIHNYRVIYAQLQLMDLCGIKKNNTIRLNNTGIFTVTDFFNASVEKLRRAFESINGWYWYLRIHGFEADDVVFGRRSYGNSFALPKPFSTPQELAPILAKLTEKTGFRMRRAGYFARGVHLALLYRDWSYWHHGQTRPEPVFDSRDIYKIAFGILLHSPYRKPVRTLAVSCFNLEKKAVRQLTLLADAEKKEKLVEAMDKITERWGQFVITPALMLGTHDLVPDRIAFGGAKELEEIITD